MKKLVVFIVLLTALGFGGYKYAMGIVSDKVVDEVANQISDEEVNELLSDPGIMAFVQQEQVTDRDDLPFTTKEQALKTVAKKFTLQELNQMKEQLSGGLDLQEKMEILATLESKLSPEELEALKVIAIKEVKARSE